MPFENLHSEQFSDLENSKFSLRKSLTFSSKMVKNLSKSVWVEARELKFLHELVC
jgi:hypothetical protein